MRSTDKVIKSIQRKETIRDLPKILSTNLPIFAIMNLMMEIKAMNKPFSKGKIKGL
jgi:hypothetical protein